jgi:hypothetical protein
MLNWLLLGILVVQVCELYHQLVSTMATHNQIDVYRLYFHNDKKWLKWLGIFPSRFWFIFLLTNDISLHSFCS